MLKLYDHMETMLEEHNNHQWYVEAKLNYFAGEVLEMLSIEEPEEISEALGRALKACRTLRIPVNRHFKKVYRFNGDVLITDWKISSFASYLIIINCNPVHETVAKAQLYFAMNQSVHSRV